MSKSHLLASDTTATVPASRGRSAQVAGELAGESARVERLRELVRRAAGTNGGVLLVAERGVDVESVAREIHGRSRWSAAAFATVDCGSGDGADVDRLLFGRPGGQRPSDLESVSSDSSLAACRRGTLMLQEVGELPSAVQARLARVARDGEVRIDGRAAPTAVRLIASASAAIDADVRANRFRADLYRRLAKTRIDLPPLRDRLEDIPALVARVLDEMSALGGTHPRTLAPAALTLFAALAWPGNLAELRQVLERAVAITDDEVIEVEHLLPALRRDGHQASFAPTGNLREARLRFERDYITAVLQHHEWRIADAAQTLGIQRPNLYRKARQLGIPFTKAVD